MLDCFSGSGSSAIAAYENNRNFICIEKDKVFFDASVKRLEDHKKQSNFFIKNTPIKAKQPSMFDNDNGAKEDAA